MKALSIRPWRGEHGHPLGPTGVTICLVELVDVRRVTPEDAESACLPLPPGFDFAWVLADARLVEQRPVKGRLGLFDLAD